MHKKHGTRERGARALILLSVGSSSVMTGALARADADEDGAVQAAVESTEQGALPWSEAPWDAPDVRTNRRARWGSHPVILADPRATLRTITSSRGDGCLDEIDVTLSKDGRDLTAQFYFHELHLEPEQRLAQGLCRALITLESDVPVSFAVTRVYAQGFTVLDPGVEARLGLRYHGPADDVRAPIERVVAAPSADDPSPGRRHGFLLEREYDAEEPVWSPCSRASELELRTLFELRSDGEAGGGWADMCRSTTDGRRGQAGLSLVWRACEL